MLMLAALGLALAAPSAFATRVIFDPPPMTTNAIVLPPPSANCIPAGQYTPCNASLVNIPYLVDFVSCSQIPGGIVPSDMTWCLWMNNVSQHSVSKFTFEFFVPSNGGENLQCGWQGQYAATDNCPSTVPSDGSLMSISFFTTPSIPNNTDFYLFTDFGVMPGTAKVTMSVPEPGQLGLFGLGLLALGLGYGWRKRHQVRSNLAG
jgi:hypothetical protein